MLITPTHTNGQCNAMASPTFMAARKAVAGAVGADPRVTRLATTVPLAEGCLR